MDSRVLRPFGSRAQFCVFEWVPFFDVRSYCASPGSTLLAQQSKKIRRLGSVEFICATAGSFY